MSAGAITAAGRGAPAQVVEQFGRSLWGDGLGEFRALSDVAACLVPLLSAIGWNGEPRHLAEALPHFADRLDIEELRGVLANLNLVTRPRRLVLANLDPRLAPCLFLPDRAPAMVVLRRDADGLTVFDGANSTIGVIDGAGLRGTAYFVSRAETTPGGKAEARGDSWFQGVAGRFRALVWRMACVSLVSSLLALATPLFIMAVYDRVVTSQSTEMLAFLASGVVLALLVDMGLRIVRARMLAYLGARIDHVLGVAAFRQVLHLPLIMTERATIGAQLSRLKQFEAVREFFIGPLAGVFLELPFVVIFVAVIAVIAGPLAWIPVVLIGLFALAALVCIPIIRARIAETGESRSERQSFLIELFTSFRGIKTLGAEAVWSERHRELSARHAWSNFRAAQISNVVQTLAQSLMLAAGIATLGIGAFGVMDGTITIGALVACMALVWRVLTPLQLAFLSFTRLEQVLLGLGQLNQLMRLKPERELGAETNRYRKLGGEVAFSRVSLRYTPTSEPALLGVGLQVAKGQVVAITGPNGSGKSSILKLVAGLYQPQAGAVLIDGIDIRQLDTAELRGAIAYVPQSCRLFHGTIAQNLRLACPTATDADLARAAVEAGLLEDILTLPDGFETRITDQVQRRLPKGFTQRLMLARAYVKEAPIYLLDEPGNNLDAEGDQALLRKLQQLRGRATVFVVTHRPSHMRVADRVLCLDGGQIALDGGPDEVLPKLGMV